MRNILVTGGAGYVGSVMTRMLLEMGYHVRVLDSLRKGGAGLFAIHASGGPVRSNLEFIRGDIRDEKVVAQALDSMEAIIHLAAIVGFPACRQDPWAARQINVDATLLLDKLRHRDQPILFGSSLSNYGTTVGQVCTEDMTPQPITLYGETKLEAEQNLLKSGNVVLFRPATAFGLSPQMRLDLLFNDFVFRAVKERYLVVYEPEFVRAFIHVQDFSRAFIFALQNLERMRDQIYNLGAESLNLSKGDLARRIRAKVDFVLEFNEVGKDPDKRNYTVDFSRLRETGFRCQVSIEDGIDELVRGFQVLDVVSPYTNTAW